MSAGSSARIESVMAPPDLRSRWAGLRPLRPILRSYRARRFKERGSPALTPDTEHPAGRPHGAYRERGAARRRLAAVRGADDRAHRHLQPERGRRAPGDRSPATQRVTLAPRRVRLACPDPHSCPASRSDVRRCAHRRARACLEARQLGLPLADAARLRRTGPRRTDALPRRGRLVPDGPLRAGPGRLQWSPPRRCVRAEPN